jgi:hypothetical protein
MINNATKAAVKIPEAINLILSIIIVIMYNIISIAPKKIIRRK